MYGLHTSAGCRRLSIPVSDPGFIHSSPAPATTTPPDGTVDPSRCGLHDHSGPSHPTGPGKWNISSLFSSPPLTSSLLQTEAIAVCSRSWTQVAQTTGFWILLGVTGYQGLVMARDWWGNFRRRRNFRRLRAEARARVEAGLLHDDRDGPYDGDDSEGGGGPEGGDETVGIAAPSQTTTTTNVDSTGSQSPRDAGARGIKRSHHGARPKVPMPEVPSSRPLRDEIARAKKVLDESQKVLARVAGVQSRLVQHCLIAPGSPPGPNILCF